MKIPKSSFKTVRERRLTGNLQERRTSPHTLFAMKAEAIPAQERSFKNVEN